MITRTWQSYRIQCVLNFNTPSRGLDQHMQPQIVFLCSRSLRPTPSTKASLRQNGPTVASIVTQSPALQLPGENNSRVPISAQTEYTCAASHNAIPRSSTFHAYRSCTTLSAKAWLNANSIYVAASWSCMICDFGCHAVVDGIYS